MERTGAFSVDIGSCDPVRMDSPLRLECCFSNTLLLVECLNMSIVLLSY